jgi:hypothetical protein
MIVCIPLRSVLHRTKPCRTAYERKEPDEADRGTRYPRVVRRKSVMLFHVGKTIRKASSIERVLEGPTRRRVDLEHHTPQLSVYPK